MAGDWSNEQNDAIVADYFAMLGDDIAGQPYSKAEHNRLLQALIDRPRGSIEYKNQNISAVLKGLGEDWIPGYKPAFNFQASLWCAGSSVIQIGSHRPRGWRWVRRRQRSGRKQCCGSGRHPRTAMRRRPTSSSR
ncbi:MULTISPECIES: hypothetical protein [Sphingomonas]|uniref:Uncharacterized protein n=1 Tax=Sphingomonas molluscorum TaxID=418184 RepID=A0ABU8Q3S2_9SPHN|nr:hypothetical protein [Sphingomonas sp. JUb134]MBM7405916.1 hypothetical protein [Sphingomonas sp. JUb134]